MIPLPLNGAETIFWICRGKIICCGCIYDQFLVDRKDGHLTIDESSFRICPFCRNGSTTFDILDREMKLAKVGHPTALFRIGIRHFDGELLQRDTQEGIKWFRRVAEAGEAEAAFNLGVCYSQGDGVEQDTDRAMEYLQKAAELGYAQGFAAIGNLLEQKGSIEEGFLNYRKAAICGYCDKELFGVLRDGYKYGYITKEEYAFTLRENQRASNEMKSESREKY